MKNDLRKRIAILEAQVVAPVERVVGVRSINPPPQIGRPDDREGLVRVCYGRWGGDDQDMTVATFWARYPRGTLVEITYADTFHQLRKDAVRRLSELGRLQGPSAQQSDLSIDALYCQHVTVREIGGPLTAPMVHTFCGCSDNHSR